MEPDEYIKSQDNTIRSPIKRKRGSDGNKGVKKPKETLEIDQFHSNDLPSDKYIEIQPIYPPGQKGWEAFKQEMAKALLDDDKEKAKEDRAKRAERRIRRKTQAGKNQNL